MRLCRHVFALFSVALLTAVGRLLFLRRRQQRERLTRGAVALITGGGSGIGLELARIFSRAGCYVVLVGRREAALEAARQTCEREGASGASLIVADLSSKEGTDRVRDTFFRAHADLKYLVLNAGGGAIQPFSSDPAFEVVCEEMMRVNYFANVRLLQAFLPSLARCHAETDPSRVIVMSSLAGVLPSTLRTAYTASKHAIQGFVNALRGETEVRFTLCCPGYVDTEFHQRVMTSEGAPLVGGHRRGMPADRCAAECVAGALRGDSEVIFTFMGKLGYMIRPLLTGIVDGRAKRISLKSLERSDKQA